MSAPKVSVPFTAHEIEVMARALADAPVALREDAPNRAALARKLQSAQARLAICGSRDASVGEVPACDHEEALFLPCGPQICPDCGAEVTIGCEGNDFKCKVCCPPLVSATETAAQPLTDQTSPVRLGPRT